MSQQSAGKTVMCQGRLVWVAGDLFKGRVKTEFGTQTPRRNAKGEEMREYGFGLAVPKSVLGQSGPGQPGEIWAAIHAEAMSLFPGAAQIPPSFAMKYKDGDGIDDKGLPFAQREGYAGHLVFACTTSMPIKFFRFENGANIMINEGIKCGDYVRVQLSIKAHGAIGAGKAGLYLNPNAVQFLGYGKEIVNTPSGDQLFGTQAPPMPPEASATPLAPTTGLLVPTQAAVPGYGQAPAMPTYAQPAAPPAMIQPNYNVVPPQFQPPAGGVPMPQAAPQTPAMPPMPGVPPGYPQGH